MSLCLIRHLCWLWLANWAQGFLTGIFFLEGLSQQLHASIPNTEDQDTYFYGNLLKTCLACMVLPAA